MGRHHRPWLKCLLFAALCGLQVAYRIWDDLPNAAFFAFQARDLDRALRVAGGSLILWGPEMTGGGVLPGGLYYWLMAIPFSLGLSWKGAWYLEAILWGGAWTLLASLQLRMGGWRSAWLGLVIFLPVSIYVAFLNSSYAAPFIVIATLGVLLAFSAREEGARRRAWCLAGIAVGLGLQLHYTAITVLVAGIALQLFGERFEVPRLPRRVFVSGLLFFLVPLLPYAAYYISSMAGRPLGETHPPGTGGGDDALASLAYLAIGALDDIELLAFLEKVSLLVPFPLLAASLAFAVVPPSPRERKALGRLRRFWVTLFFLSTSALLPALYYFLRPNGARYVIPFSVSTLLLTCLAFRPVQLVRRRALIFIILNTFFSFVFAVFAWLSEADSRMRYAMLTPFLFLAAFFLWPRQFKNRRLTSFSTLALLSAAAVCIAQAAASSVPWRDRSIPILKVEGLSDVAELVIMDTGWTYEEARHRLFFLGNQFQFSFRHVYEELFARLKPKPRDPGYDGYIVATTGERNLLTSGLVRKWILSLRLQSDLKRALETGAVELGEPKLGHRLAVIPYRVLDREHFPISFHNTGYPYETMKSDDVLIAAKGTIGALRLPDGQLLFHWIDCSDAHCETGILAREERRGERLMVRARITGAPLAQVSEWTLSGRVQMWRKPWLRVRCGGKAETRELVDSVGINSLWASKVDGMNQSYSSFLAPLDRELTFRCAGELEEIAAGREATVIYSLHGEETVAPPEAVYRFHSR